jgi:hypothetical protein
MKLIDLKHYTIIKKIIIKWKIKKDLSNLFFTIQNNILMTLVYVT